MNGRPHSGNVIGVHAGEWLNGKPHGRGEAKYYSPGVPQVETATPTQSYKGEFVNGQRDGQGIYVT